MNHIILLLRGINVSGKNIIKMADLQDLCRNIGFESVETYIQSGNIVVQTHLTPTDAAHQLHQGIQNTFGLDVPTLGLNGETLREMMEQSPMQQEGIPITEQHYTLLHAQPDPTACEKLMSYDYPPDRIIQGDQVVYVHCPNGYGQTKFTNTFVEKKLGVGATTRNGKTMLKLLEMSGNN